MRRLNSLWSSSATAMRMRVVVLFPWLPNTVAKIEKNKIGSTNVIACATRSRFRLVQLTRSSVAIITGVPVADITPSTLCR